MNMLFCWLILAGIFLLVEVLTTALVSIWFAAGALVAAAAAAAGAALWLQAVFFVLVSAFCFVLLYPRMKHLVEKNKQATNADKVIGQTCIVTQKIDNLAGTGTVIIDGKTWTARSADGEPIEAQTLVQINRIEGVKLIVTQVKQPINIS
jgi:membrane protein implicated in regulation of membrane protease activity